MPYSRQLLDLLLKFLKMKKIIITILVFIAIQAIAQTEPGLRVGLKGSYNSTWIINQDVSDAPDTTYIPSFGYTIGAGIRYDFIPHLGIAVDFLLNKHKQNYGNDGTGSDWNINKKLNLMTLNFLLRYSSEMGFFVELGPQYNTMKKATEEMEMYFPQPINDYQFVYTNRDIKEHFTKSHISYIFGFGGEWDITENIYFMSGLRFNYSMDDAVSETGKKNDSIYRTNHSSPSNFVWGGVLIGIFYRFNM